LVVLRVFQGFLDAVLELILLHLLLLLDGLLSLSAASGQLVLQSRILFGALISQLALDLGVQAIEFV
jgi:hypothetical protein